MQTRRELIESMHAEATAWRRELHAHPQTMYEEVFASDFVAAKLTEWGIPHERGIAGTGIVGTIEGRRNGSGRTVAFRADMDALDITEASGQPWSSKNPGKMHACGHDGHTATLLSLAWYLQKTRNFDGTVRLIFQPAEEGGRGAFRMLEEGLLERFPFDEIYGFHNFPGIQRGVFAIRPGPMLASVDVFEIKLMGLGGHAGMPQLTCDMVPAAAQLVLALQTLVSREIDPVAAGVVSVTNVQAGTGAHNVVAETARLTGTVRTFADEVRDHLEQRIREMAEATALTFRGTSEVEYHRLMDATVNHEEETRFCQSAAAAVAGERAVIPMHQVMGGEDFGGFLQVRPGAFIGLGQSEGHPASPHDAGLHTPQYDFNDAILPIATEYFAELAERRLPVD